MPNFEPQYAIVAEIEAEQVLANANRELIERFEKKIQASVGHSKDKVNRVEFSLARRKNHA